MRPVRLVVYLMAVCLLAGAQKPPSSPDKAKPEALSQEKFSEIHAPLLQPAKTNEAGALTERVARALPATPGNITKALRRNYIDDQIFGNLERAGVPHAQLTRYAELLRR